LWRRRKRRRQAEENGVAKTKDHPRYRKRIVSRIHATLQEKAEGHPTLEDVDEEIQSRAASLAEECGETDIYPLLLEAPKTSISSALVDDVFEELYGEFGTSNEKLMVIISSSGGDMDAAYSLAMLLRRFGSERLVFVVPRTAKSAATLLACSGDEILMSPVAELGPVDTQITHATRADGREEEFSALHIKTALEIIGDQYKNGDQRLAEALLQRLQYPLTLGSFRKSLEIGKTYAQRLLESRMLSDEESKANPDEESKANPDEESKAKHIAGKLVEGYESHNTCIDYGEASELGLTVKELDGQALVLAWEIHRLERKKAQMIEEQDRQQVLERLSNLPPEFLEVFLTSEASS
jgi:hypothetical protein